MLALPSLSERFSAIYTNNLWESAESKSGLGSEITFTLALRSWLVEAIPKNIEFAVIGAVILAGVAADEVVKRMAAKRKAAKEFEAAKSES